MPVYAYLINNTCYIYMNFSLKSVFPYSGNQFRPGNCEVIFKYSASVKNKKKTERST